MSYLDDLPLAGKLTGVRFDGWEDWLREEFVRNDHNGRVGGTLLDESSHARVWEIRLAPGERVPAHRHVLDYFWLAHAEGRSRQHTHDGTTREVAYRTGEIRQYHFGCGEFLLHDLENIGTTELWFTTVEFLRSANAPLPLGER
ncbi:hypothetical protein [Amycolatopsis sp. CA-230715]|uniref:hypothetical protein n=1 Tax=Amycolatopsis sp. CA-230715 TaxID=2745196 RepID=UPI001C03518C|nr:hypothetical protein [Amycolatopsis sp. CA-230715]QWF83445.1 hypothetical protein HUW46_06886 [Amycolatopsis sp. CA-230715]